jgi:short-subunit dehydrogenase
VFAGRHITLTGASSGIGAALAQHFAAQGAILSLAGRNPERLDAVVTACRTRIPRGADPVERNAKASVTGSVVDVTNADMTSKWLAETEARCPIDIMIANAGIGGARAIAGPSGETLEAAHEIVATNVTGLLNSVIPIVPAMRARNQGQIVLVGSLAGYVGLPQSPVYAASKAAVQIYGDGLRRLLLNSGVGVTIVSPGFVETPMSQSLPMRPPFVWTVERAAERIATGIAKRKRDIAFPGYLRFGLRLVSLLPNAAADPLLNIVDRLSARTDRAS